MEIVYTPDALKDRDFWKISGNKSVIKKITSLIASIEETPESGIGKPERLKHNLVVLVKKNRFGKQNCL